MLAKGRQLPHIAIRVADPRNIDRHARQSRAGSQAIMEMLVRDGGICCSAPGLSTGHISPSLLPRPRSVGRQDNRSTLVNDTSVAHENFDEL